jgi:hypothetical protein
MARAALPDVEAVPEVMVYRVAEVKVKAKASTS